MDILIIFAVILGIVEGITEWLPVSSTGHLILMNEFMHLEGTFFDSQIFIYVIQLGAILAIATLYFHKLNPFAPSKTKKEKSDTWQMWFKVAVACIPAAVLGLLFNDFMDTISNGVIVSIMLIIYGIGFMVVEKITPEPKVVEIEKMSYKTAIIIGLFQALSIVPGTSRSGSTILGGMLIGTSRSVAAEFSFFLAIPVMFGVSILKLGSAYLDGELMLITSQEWILLAVSMLVSYVVSLVSVKFLVNYVKNHDFKFFGYYRVVLGIIVLISFFVFR